MSKGTQLSTDLGKVMETAIADVESKSLDKFVPRDGLVLVQVLPAEKQTKAGIILPDSTARSIQEARNLAVVLSLSPETEKLVPYKVGDTVLFRTYSGEKLKWEGYGDGDLLLLFCDGSAESDILGKFE